MFLSGKKNNFFCVCFTPAWYPHLNTSSPLSPGSGKNKFKCKHATFYNKFICLGLPLLFPSMEKCILPWPIALEHNDGKSLTKHPIANICSLEYEERCFKIWSFNQNICPWCGGVCIEEGVITTWWSRYSTESEKIPRFPQHAYNSFTLSGSTSHIAK